MATAAAAIVVTALVNRPQLHSAVPRALSHHGAGATANVTPAPAPGASAGASAAPAGGAASPLTAANAGGAQAPTLTVTANPAGAELLALADDVRGLPHAQQPVAPITVASGATELRFAVPTSLLGADLPDSLGVELVSPSGRVLCATRIASRSLYPRRMISIRSGATALAEGSYRVRFRLAAHGVSAEPREYAFVLRH